jgi:tripartite-type tricarboxylate transporter receptor subunit TctC
MNIRNLSLHQILTRVHRMANRIRCHLLLLLALSAASWSHAQPYPAKPVRVVIGYAPGAGNDVIGRLVFAELSKSFGQQFIVDNRPGASGNIAAEMVARSAPDGYVLLNAPGSIAMSSSLFTKLPYDLFNDLEPVAIMASVPFVLAVHPSLPVKSVRELIAFAKARPGQLTYGSGGTGGGPHLTAEMFAMRTGLKLLHVPYRGTAPANIAVASGEITMIFAPSASITPSIQSKRVRPLAITSTERHPSFPQVPTMAEAALPDFDARNWIALFAPRGTPEESILRLNAEINRIVKTSSMRERFAAVGAEAMTGTPKECAAYVRSEAGKWAKVIKAAGVKPE